MFIFCLRKVESSIRHLVDDSIHFNDFFFVPFFIYTRISAVSIIVISIYYISFAILLFYFFIFLFLNFSLSVL